jgi:hypothetical protein
MSLTISLVNSGDTDQQITLFDNGGSGVSTFVSADNNIIIVPQTTSVGVPLPAPQTQEIIFSNLIYYQTLFNPSNNLTYSSATNYVQIDVIYLSVVYQISTGIISSGLTLSQLNTLVTNAIQTNVNYPRPNANFQFTLESVNGVNFLKPNLFDDIEDTSIFNYASLTTNSDGQYLTSYPFDQVYTYSANSSQIVLNTFPDTSFQEDGWHTIQCSGLTSPSSQTFIGFLDSYMGTPTGATIEVQLTQTLAQNFRLNDGVTLQTILGSTTAIQTFSIANTGSVGFYLAGGFPSGYNGQIKVRAVPDGASLVASSVAYSLPTSINSYLQGNPNVTAKSSVTGVGLTEILNSVIGNSYKVTSLYIWSINPVQLTQSITYGVIEANGNVVQTDLDIVIDPYAQNSVTYRTNDVNGFIIDNNAFIQFILKAQSAVNMKFEYEKIGSDEIKLIEMGLGGLLAQEFEEKSAIDEQLANDFDTFYLKQ